MVMAIDSKLFTLEKLLVALLDNMSGNVDVWRRTATIIPNYMATKDAQPRCVVTCNGSFLRYSRGPRQGHFWDIYGDDYNTPELALIALLEAPIPPSLIMPKGWEQ